MIKSNFRTGSDIINLIKLGVNDIIICLGLKRMYPVTSISAAVVTCDSTIYNRNNQVAQNIVVTFEGNTLVEYRDYVVSSNQGGTNVGNYTVTITGIDNYEGTASGTFTINKANPTYTAPTGKSLTYNGSAQSIVNGGYSNDGIIQYSTDNSNWSATVPTQTNAGNYTTYWRFIGDGGNFYDIGSTSLSSSIAKANQSAPTAYGSTTTYNTTATASASGGGGQGSLEWSNGNTQTSIGSKTTKARWAGNNNYNASSWSNEVTLTMNKASGSVTSSPSARSLTFNGSSQTLINAGSGTGTMYYSLDGSNYSTSLPSAIGPGSWTVYYYAAATSTHTQSGVGTLTASISQTTYGGHEYVDFGLSVKWATINVGASSVGEYGTYYKAYEGTDYVVRDWGNGWRMPTFGECSELVDNTNASVVTVNGYNCVKLTSKTNSNLFIYFPLAGLKSAATGNSPVEDAGVKGIYSTKTPKDSTYVFTLRFDTSNGGYMSFDYHYWGSLRGVF